MAHRQGVATGKDAEDVRKYKLGCNGPSHLALTGLRYRGKEPTYDEKKTKAAANG